MASFSAGAVAKGAIDRYLLFRVAGRLSARRGWAAIYGRPTGRIIACRCINHYGRADWRAVHPRPVTPPSSLGLVTDRCAYVYTVGVGKSQGLMTVGDTSSDRTATSVAGTG